MDEKMKDQDVLLVKEQGDDQLKVVSGMNENGKLKTVAPKQENEPDFMLMARHSNQLENSFPNLRPQPNTPPHFGFFRSPAENAPPQAALIV